MYDLCVTEQIDKKKKTLLKNEDKNIKIHEM